MTRQREIKLLSGEVGCEGGRDMTSDPRLPNRKLGDKHPGSRLQSPTELNPSELLVSPSDPALPEPSPQPKIAVKRVKKWLNPTSWQFWLLMTALPGGIGLLALAMLLRLPTLPNCPAIFWPTASASLRIYCGELAASKQTVDDLLYAIELVNALPADHPMRSRINQLIEQWAGEILDLGDRVFNQGKLKEAIAIARKVPSQTTAYKLVDERIKQWEEIWGTGDKIYQRVEELIGKEEWNLAFRIATQLLFVKNTYWQTTKYEEVNNLIQVARKDGEQLSKARRLAYGGTVEDLLEAIKIAETIAPKSYIYQQARKEIQKFGRQMLELAEAEADKGNFADAVAIANQIPDSVKLQADINDFKLLTEAQLEAADGTSGTLEAAILKAQRIERKRPLYQKAQDLIARWQIEIEDVAHLEKARRLATTGQVKDLAGAIAEISLIPPGNPRYSEARDLTRDWRRDIETQEDIPYLNRAESLALSGDAGALQAAISEASLIAPGRALYDEAQGKIQQWRNTVETTEDRPYLDSADQWAMRGDLASLQTAIQEASRIGEGRSLYPEARDKIRQWQRQIQRMQDQPILNQAREAAAAGNLVRAIQIAQQIGSNRVLYDDATELIQGWQSQLRSQDNLSEARNIAVAGTPEALVAAIRTANQIPQSSLLRLDADLAIAQWSQQIFNLAQDRAAYDVAGAIAIADRVPVNTDAYARAQSQIQIWKQQIAIPSPVPSLPPNR